MTTVHGKNTELTGDGNDLSAYCDNSEFSQTVDTDEDTSYGSDNKTYIPSLIDGTFTFGGRYDDGASGPKAVIEAIIDGDAAVAWVRKPEGTGDGLPNEAFNGIVTSYVETNPVGGKITFSCDVQITGAVTRTTQSV